MKTVMSQCKKRLIEAVQYQYFRNCSSLNILQHKRYIRTTNLYMYYVLANSKGVRTKSILGWTQTSNLVLTLNKRKIYFVYVQMYQNVKNTWGYLISMTYRRRNCEKSSSFKWSWLSWICFPHNLFTFSWTQRGARSEGWFTCSGRGLSRRRITLASPRTPIWPFGSVAMLYPSDKATTESLLPESMAPSECLMARQVWWQPAGEKGRSGRRNLILSAHTWADEDDGNASPSRIGNLYPTTKRGMHTYSRLCLFWGMLKVPIISKRTHLPWELKGLKFSMETLSWNKNENKNRFLSK